MAAPNITAVLARAPSHPTFAAWVRGLSESAERDPARCRAALHARIADMEAMAERADLGHEPTIGAMVANKVAYIDLTGFIAWMYDLRDAVAAHEMEAA